MDCSMLDIPVHHQLLKFTQTHVHWVSDVIQPSHPLSSSSPPAFNLSQHQGLFQWVSSSYQVAKVLEFQLQHQSFQWISRTVIDWFDLTVQGTLKSLLQHKGLTRAAITWVAMSCCLSLTAGPRTTWSISLDPTLDFLSSLDALRWLLPGHLGGSSRMQHLLCYMSQADLSPHSVKTSSGLKSFAF